jgi:hypothetical protein
MWMRPKTTSAKSEVFPERVGDLDGRVEGVTEGDHAPSARVDHIDGVAGRACYEERYDITCIELGPAKV